MFESCDGATETLDPDGVLYSVKIARTTSATSTGNSAPTLVGMTYDGQPCVGSCVVRKNPTADCSAVSVPVPPTAPRPSATYAVIWMSPASYEPAESWLESRYVRYSLTFVPYPPRSLNARNSDPSPSSV